MAESNGSRLVSDVTTGDDSSTDDQHRELERMMSGEYDHLLESSSDTSSLDDDVLQELESNDHLDLGPDCQVGLDILQRCEESPSGERRERHSTSTPLYSEWWTNSPDKQVKIRFGESKEAQETPETVVSMFEKVLVGYSEHVAMAVKRGGQWKTWTYRKYYEESISAAKAMIELGLEPAHGVCILGFNSPEWHLTNMASIMAGGLSVGLYLTSTAEACFNYASDCKANIIMVENDTQLQKILQVKQKLPHLKAIVQMTKEVVQRDESGVYDWMTFMNLGKRTGEARLKQRMDTLQPTKCCAVIYTSGTSGRSKGVMISHDNVTWMCRRIQQYIGATQGGEHIVSYLPLSHIATQLLDVYTVMVTAGTCWFAQPDALKGSLLQTLKEVHPTIFLGVPRVWEKIAESMQLVARNTRGLKAKVASWAKGVGLKTNLSKQTGSPKRPFGFTIANAIFFKKVRLAIGLDRCHFPMTGAAPTNEDTLTYFMSINIPLYEMYGMSETCGPTTVTTTDTIRFCSVGRPFAGVDIKIDEPDEDGTGEVLVRGRHVFMGYLGQAEATRDVVTSDGWVRSGDMGYISKENYLYITGRKKELIITASGEKIAPVPIESAIKRHLPIVSNAMVVGDQQKYLSCLLTLKVEVDHETGLPTNQLSAVALEACQKVGSNALTVNDVTDGDHKILKSIQRGIDRTNKTAICKIQKIARWSILEQDFSIAGGELTPTLKLKRSLIMMKYLDCIESFYNS